MPEPGTGLPHRRIFFRKMVFSFMEKTDEEEKEE